MISYLYAESAATAQGASPSPLISMMPLVVIFVIFYFLLIRPQQKKMKEHKKMVADLKKGDRIITSSGFYAVVVGIGESTLEIKLAENLKVKILKSSVSEVLGNQETPNSANPANSEEEKIVKV